jgi:hypothetical protein
MPRKHRSLRLIVQNHGYLRQQMYQNQTYAQPQSLFFPLQTYI